MKKKYILYLIVFLILTVLTTYKNSTIFNSKEKITITEIQKLAEKGNPEALNILSWIYFRGDKEFKIEKNNEKGIHYMTKAAEKKQVNSMTDLGWFSFTGEYGVKKDFKKAVYWNEKASSLKFATATYNIGLFYYAGIADLPQDLTKAKKYWVLSAEQWKNRNEGTTAESLLEEINRYSNNQTKEMMILRDAYIDFVRDPSSFNLRKLKSI
jgi:TPR repeat protein